ncbi:MAG: hypothetical protein ACI86H_000470 [bacterium]
MNFLKSILQEYIMDHKVYTSLEEALKEPDKVLALDLSQEKFDQWPSEIIRFKTYKVV